MPATTTTHAEDLADFVDASPSSYHAAAEVARRLLDAGFTSLHESDAWPQEPGRYVVVREGAVIDQTFDLHQQYGARNWRFSAQGPADLEPRRQRVRDQKPPVRLRERLHLDHGDEPCAQRHQRRIGRWQQQGQTVQRSFLAMPWRAPDGRSYFIWGATATILRNFYHFLAAD